MKRDIIAVLLCLIVVPVLRADVLTAWGDGSDGTEFVLNQGLGTILIRKGDGNTYKFYSETVAGNNTPGVINDITVDSTASGNFSGGVAWASRLRLARVLCEAARGVRA